MSKPQNAPYKPSKESSLASKKPTASVSKSKGGPGTEAKGSVPELEPRITRRMSKLKQNGELVQGKCVICLGNYQNDYGKLLCGHIFCLDCLMTWWRTHKTCPYCREEITCIMTAGDKVIAFEDLPPVMKNPNDEEFVAHCELCWGEIEDHEEMNICTVCRGVYWHRRCLPFKNNKWYCIECAGAGEEEGEDQ